MGLVRLSPLQVSFLEQHLFQQDLVFSYCYSLEHPGGVSCQVSLAGDQLELLLWCLCLFLSP